jgi:hypothetical protein
VYNLLDPVANLGISSPHYESEDAS